MENHCKIVEEEIKDLMGGQANTVKEDMGRSVSGDEGKDNCNQPGRRVRRNQGRSRVLSMFFWVFLFTMSDDERVALALSLVGNLYLSGS